MRGEPEVRKEGGVEGEGEAPQRQEAPSQPGHNLPALHLCTTNQNKHRTASHKLLGNFTVRLFINQRLLVLME